jgi:NAD(P)-dependent dehydrogenase (short-subunit alcohol dehydrogenase family)
MFRLTELFDLTGRTALVTGGSSGIGKQMAQALGMAGAHLVLVARREDELAKASAEFLAEGLSVSVISADMAEADCASKIESALALQKRKVDIIVNAAGMNLRQPFGDVSAENFDAHMAVHLRAPFLLTQTFAPAMAAQKWGRIINIGSLQSYRAFANSAPYGAAKGGVVQLTRAIAEEWSKHGITCNAIAPGFFPTALTAPVFSDVKRASGLAAQTAVGRNGLLSDLDGATVFLASNASAYITGQTLPVDGGFTAK